jgi:NAD(P)-dependent dehydrogenase (short-subunit alcohol dehydrogenase family)
MKRLARKVCIITGGAGGIGIASVRRFLAEGARVVLADINDTLAQQHIAQLTAEGCGGPSLRYCHCDVSHEPDVVAMMEFTVAEFGRIDSIFNNAGVGGAYGPLIQTRAEDWDRTQAMILRGTFLCCKHAARVMIRQGAGGSIVNNASVVARVGDSAGAAYSAAKAGVLSLTQSAALELAPHHIRVNAVSPGTIITPLLHRGGPRDALCRLAVQHQPWPEADTGEYVAAAAALLASDDSRFVTGEDLVVDGGASAAGPGFDNTSGAMRQVLERLHTTSRPGD